MVYTSLFNIILVYRKTTDLAPLLLKSEQNSSVAPEIDSYFETGNLHAGMVPKALQPPDGRRHGRAALPRIIDDIESDAWKRACAQASDLKSVLGNREFTQMQAKELACR
jgi:hypothetical protein